MPIVCHLSQSLLQQTVLASFIAQRHRLRLTTPRFRCGNRASRPSRAEVAESCPKCPSKIGVCFFCQTETASGDSATAAAQRVLHRQLHLQLEESNVPRNLILILPIALCLGIGYGSIILLLE